MAGASEGAPPFEEDVLAGPGSGGGSLPFLGRRVEMAALQDALRRAATGTGALVLVSGEPGIGKSRLLAEFAAAASRRPDPPLVVSGRCWEGGGGPSLWPWRTLIRDICRQRSTEQLRDELGSGAPWVAALVPELGGWLPELTDAPAIDLEQSRYVLFDAVTSFLRAVGESRRLLLTLDDLHAGDDPTLLALRYLAPLLVSMPVLIVAGHRVSEVRRSQRLSEEFGHLARHAQRLRLDGLGHDDLARLIAHRGGSSPGRLASVLHDATGGNPFFTDEALRMLAARGELDGAGRADLVPLTAGVQAVIEQRLEALPAPVTELLRHAAVAGNPFSLSVISHALELPAREVAETLEPAIDEHLIRPHDSEVGLYAWEHALTREAVLAAMNATAKALAHARVAGALERRYAGSIEFHLPELAHHHLAALPAGDPGAALDYAERAAEQATGMFAHEEAERLYAAALEVLDLADLEPPARGRTRARLLFGLGRARQRMGHPRTRPALLEAAAAARAAGDPALLAATAQAYGAFGFSGGFVDRELIGLLEEALEANADADAATRVALLGRLARALYWGPDEPRRLALVRETEAVARAAGDPRLLAGALAECLLASRSVDDPHGALRYIEEILSLPGAPGEAIVLARSNEIDIQLDQGRIGAADAALDALAADATALRDLRILPMVPIFRARRAMMEGDFDRAAELLDEAAELAERVRDSTFPLTIGGGHVALDLLRGDFDRIEARTVPLVHALPDMPLWRACLAIGLVGLGETERAARELERAVAGGVAAMPRNVMWLITTGLLAEAAAAAGSEVLVRELYDALLPFAGRNVISPVSGYRGPVDRYLGLLAGRLGDRDAAERHLRAATALAAAQHQRPLRDAAAADLQRLTGDAGARAHPVVREVAGSGSLRREGDVWTFTLEGTVVRMRDGKGMRHLAVLLGRPGEEIHSLDLGADVAGPPATTPAAHEGLAIDTGGGSGPALDEDAKRAYRHRLDDLREQLDEAERWGDGERVARAREEIDFLTAELAAAVGLGGRNRPQHSAAERARVNVTRAIRTAIRRIADADAALGAELDSTVRTGLFCRYEPDPRRPVSWTVRE